MSAKQGVDAAREEPRDAEDLQREADAIRADLDRTLNALERKLSPRQLLDRSLNYVQENGGDILQKIGTTVSKHPLPLLASAAGLLWFAANRQARSRSRFRAPSYAPHPGDFDANSQSLGGTRSGRAANRLKHRASRTFDRTRERTTDLGSNLKDAIQEQPLVCGAIALAVGAVVAAAIPASQYERGLFARARESGGSMLEKMTARSGAPPTSH